MAARILVAEDHLASLELMRYLLTASGYQPVTVTDGAAAVSIAGQAQPDLIICDLRMPLLNGFDVLAALRRDARFDAVPVVAVTAFSMLGDRESVLSAGFAGYFSKPIEPETFVTEIERFLPPDLRAPRAGR